MCIICASKTGVRQPDDRTIRNMFLSNPHGAGYMYARNGKVTIHKGFMTLTDYLDAVHSERFTADDSVVYHFRISTQAGVNPAMTHPFPLSSQRRMMRKLDLTCRIGIAHNGIIRLTSDPHEREYSDTAVFITDYISRLIKGPQELRNRKLLDFIEELARSKFALMDGSGYIATIGRYVDEGGILYSNWSFRDLPLAR